MKRNEQTTNNSAQPSRSQVLAMSFICGFLTLFALAAATRIPSYLAGADYARLIGVSLFDLLVFVGLIDNLRSHIRLSVM